MMSLNTRSKAKILFSKEQRLIELTGEGLFAVAHDSSRPFYVRTRGAIVRAVGTKFNVYEQQNETRVAVVEGVVQVAYGSKTQSLLSLETDRDRPPADASQSPTTSLALSAGEAALVTTNEVIKHALPDPSVATAWQQRLLIFEDATLEEVATQFNRYNDSQIRITDPSVSALRLSGTFDALHPQSLLLYLQKDDRVEIRSSGEDYVIVNRLDLDER